jgi:peptidoglycan/xylan/chitin deacetylase (PgdA/CDA1 family)
MLFILPFVALTATTLCLVSATPSNLTTACSSCFDPSPTDLVALLAAKKHTTTKKKHTTTTKHASTTKSSAKATHTTQPTKTTAKPTQTSTPTRPISNTVITNCVKPGTFAFTADDGPYLYGGQIASLLEQHNSVGTFFVNGNNWACIYDYADELIKRYKAGHQIAAHTWTHEDITTHSHADLVAQFSYLETALVKILGIKPAFFRPPYGDWNQPLVDTITSWGYQVVTWNLDSGDSAGVSTSESISTYDSAISQYPAPFIALNHETYQSTADGVAPNVIPKLVAKGYKLVTVAECLGMQPYQSIVAPEVRDSTWTCEGTPQPQNN